MSEEGRDRRKRPRIALHWTVYLKSPEARDAVRAETLNLSSEGFYCLSPLPFPAGQPVECTLPLPVAGEPREDRTLAGRATVLRVEEAGSGMFGIACHMEDYSLASALAPE